MDLKDATGEYAALIGDAAALAKYFLDCDEAWNNALFDALHGGKEKRPTQAEIEEARRELKRETGESPAEDEVMMRVVKDRAKAARPREPRVEANVSLTLECAIGNENGIDPFEENWRRLSDALDMSDCPDRVRDGIERRHGEFVAACASGGWREIWKCAERFAAYLLEAANAAERKSRDGYTDADRKRGEEIYKTTTDLKKEQERKSKISRKRGRANQRKGEMNGNGRKTDPRLQNQIMTEVRQTMRDCPHLSQSAACRNVALKHLKADGKTPIISKRTIENWMSEANGKRRAKKKP